MDYDELTMNPTLGENETEASSGGGGDQDAEKKTRRYWTPKEEDRFFEIWGRENWRLTRYGKNTIFFAKWSEELVERFNIDVKPEEVQAKVNQTKAKYRQVVKHMEQEKSSVTKWKKFDIIDKILRNEHRAKDADPIPTEALEKSREFSPLQPQTTGAGNATKTQSNDSLAGTTDGAQVKTENNQNNLDLTVPETIGTNSTDLDALNNSVMFNNSDSQRSTSQFSTELFTDPIDEIKQEEFSEEFDAYNVHNSNLYSQTQGQLTQLQTPQQQQLQQQQQQHQQEQQQQQEQYQEQYQSQNQMQESAMHSQQQLQQHMEQLQQQQEQQQQHQQQQMQQHSNFDQSLNSFVASPSNQRSLLNNNQNHYNNSSNTTPPMQHQASIQPTNNQYVNDYGMNSGIPSHTENLPNATPTTNSNSNGNNGSSTAANSMQPPRTNAVANTPVVQTRKRRTSMQVAAANAAAAAAAAAVANSAATEPLELLYMEEVRKKNLILDEQKEISRKRLLLEERKIALMEQFFPRCLELQEQILQKLNSK